jgi:hypothetical protein
MGEAPRRPRDRHVGSRATLAWTLAGIGLALLLGSCGFETSPSGAPCEQGARLACDCDDGSMGERSCSSLGAFGRCVCASAVQGGAGFATGGAGASGQAGMHGSNAGTSGSAGSTAAAGRGGVGGTGGHGGGAGTSIAGQGGSTGQTGDAGSHATGGGTAPAPTPSAPGSPYAYCRSNGDCDSGLACASSNTGAGSSGYCTAVCSAGGSSGGSGNPWGGTSSNVLCPQPASGTLAASCIQLVGLCLLDSCETGQCPAAMDCIATPVVTPFGSGVVYGCAYPAGGPP